MSVFFSSGLIVSETALTSNAPLLCYQNYVNTANITATSETTTNPTTNLANPATAYAWEASSTATQTITVTLTGQEIDYIGIAKHNLDQVGLTVQVKLSGVEVIAAQAVSGDMALLFTVDAASPTTVEIVIAGATTAPKIGVLYVGKSLNLQRNIYVGHTPLEYGRQRNTINGVSENGQYLGEIVVSESRASSVNMQNLTPAWYRSFLDPLFRQKPRGPFFFAWRPTTYPDEVAFCWIEGDPQMSNQRNNGMVQASFNLRGIA